MGRQMMTSGDLCHHGIKGQKWGIRRYQNLDGTYTEEGKRRRSEGYTVRSLNDIYGTMSARDKKYLIGDDTSTGDKYTTVDQHSQFAAYTYVNRHNGVPVSFIDVWDQGDGRGAIAVGTKSCEQYREKGFAKKTVEKGLEWFKNNPQINELVWEADKSNNASISLAKKYGFKEGESKNEDTVLLKKQKNGTVFVSGSSKTQDVESPYHRKDLPEEIRKQLDSYIEKGDKVIVGDAPGIDRQVQDYLHNKDYRNVEVYGPGTQVRYSADKKWKTNPIDAPEYEVMSKEWLAAKDIEMEKAADFGLAVVLDEGAKATRRNVERLISHNKDVKVYELSQLGQEYDKWV